MQIFMNLNMNLNTNLNMKSTVILRRVLLQFSPAISFCLPFHGVRRNSIHRCELDVNSLDELDANLFDVNAFDASNI